MDRIQDIAYKVLEKRRQQDYVSILSMSCQLVRQRAQLYSDSAQVVQWQQDNCDSMLDHFDIDDKPVYYKRLDPNTLQAVIEFASTPSKHFIIVLLWEDETFKYYNTKEIDEIEWQEIVQDWSNSVESANITTTLLSPDRAPDDYWGDWSSDEEHEEPRAVILDLHSKEDTDSEDDYYARWSKDPGTLTPGLNETNGRVLLDPPKDPVTELTHMLKKSLPYPTMSMTPTRTVIASESPARNVTQLVQEFRMLVDTAKDLGLENTDIMNIVQEILVNKS